MAIIYIFCTSHLSLRTWDSIDTVKSTSYFHLHLEIDRKEKLLINLYDKRYDFSFRFVIFPFICCKISFAHNGVFISQFIRYARACCNYAIFLYRARLLTIRLLEQGYVATRLKSPLQMCYSRHHEVVYRYGVSICTMKTDLFNVS